MNAGCQQIQDLIARTVSNLCKSSVPFAKEVRVEGLLGVTFDATQIFLVRINETFPKLNERTAVTLPSSDNEAAEVSFSQYNTSNDKQTASANYVGDGLSIAEIKYSEINALHQDRITLPPLIEIDYMQSTSPAENGDVVSPGNKTLQHPRELQVNVEGCEPAVTLVQPVDSNDNNENDDLAMLCLASDSTETRVEEQAEFDEGDVQLVLAPCGILDGNRQVGSRRMHLQVHSKQNLQQQQRRRENNCGISYALQSNEYETPCAMESTCTVDLTQDNLAVPIDIKPDVTEVDEVPNDLNNASSVHSTYSATPMLNATLPTCTNPSQLLASLGLSLVGFTPISTLPIVASSRSASLPAISGGTSSSRPPPDGSAIDNSLLSPEMQNFVASITRNQKDRLAAQKGRLTAHRDRLIARRDRLVAKTSRGCYMCVVCSARFLNSDDHQRHMRTHSSDVAAVSGSSDSGVLWKVTCPYCELLFGSTSTRNRHIRVVHERRVQWTCPVCLHKITRSDNIKYHSCVKAQRIALQKGNEPVN